MITINTAYFIGIGGIGMSAVARYLQQNGVVVSGYDRDDTPLIRELRSEGITVYNYEDVDHVSGAIDMVIYTPVTRDQRRLRSFYQINKSSLLREHMVRLLQVPSYHICYIMPARR